VRSAVAVFFFFPATTTQFSSAFILRIQCIEKLVLFLLLKSELRYRNPFPNGRAKKLIGARKTPIFRLKVVAMATSLDGSQKGK